MKVALVHDYLVDRGGAERVLCVLSEMFPNAPVYTFLYDADKIGDCISVSDIRPSFLNKLPAFIKKRKRWFLPFLPLAAWAFDLSEYDLIISSSSAFSKGVRKKIGAIHICYCHSPTRFLWDYENNYREENRNSAVARFFLWIPLFNLLIHFLRKWDRESAERVDFWIANSQSTQERIKKYYNKDSAIIYPPLIDFKKKSVVPIPDGDYFLMVSRLSAYKKADLAIQAFNRLRLPLVIVGDGPERPRLEIMAGDNIKFAGFVSDDVLAGYYAACRAFILANEEDFGLAALEAASFGKPVLAYRSGGATEWLEEGVSGEFFNNQTPESIAEAAHNMVRRNFPYNTERIKKSAERFSEVNFRESIIKFIDDHLL